MAGTIVIAGSVAQKPWHGGHTWVFLQYLLGFKELGWDVLFLDRLDAGMCADSKGQMCSPEASENLRYFRRIMEGFGLHGSYSLACGEGPPIGLSRKEVLRKTSRSALLLNVMGFLQDPEILSRAPRRAFLDIDPGFGQMWQESELWAAFSGYHDYITIGENIGRPDCGIPTCGLKWLTTRQPVHLREWPGITAANEARFTTVASWRGSYGPVPFQGKTYGLRVHEFRKFVALPSKTGQQFEAALDIHPADAADRAALENNGWRLVDPRLATGDPWKYRSYVASSGAEFTAAKNMYVETRSGWFSDRSICYLASGKPVLVQDTGLSHLYPTGKGLLTFSSVEEAVCRAKELASNYAAHSEAARQIAAEYFDSNKVLSRLLQKLCIN
jgi:hypothetical protein